MSEEVHRRKQASELIEQMLPIAQELNDYLFQNERFQKLTTPSALAAFAILAGGLARACDLSKGEIVLLVEAAWDRIEAAEKTNADRNP